VGRGGGGGAVVVAKNGDSRLRSEYGAAMGMSGGDCNCVTNVAGVERPNL